MEWIFTIRRCGHSFGAWLSLASCALGSCRCGCLGALLLLLCCHIYPVCSLPAWIEYLHVLLSRLFILFSFHVPCVTSLYFMLPSTFLRVLAWHGTHDAGHTCWNIFYVHCVRPVSGRNHNKKECASNLTEFILRSFPLIVSCFLPGPVQVLLIFTCKQNKFNLPLFLYVMFIISSYFSFVLFMFFKPVSLLFPYPSGICSYLFISRTFFLYRLLLFLVLSGFPFSLLFVCCYPCFSLHFVVHASMSCQT